MRPVHNRLRRIYHLFANVGLVRFATLASAYAGGMTLTLWVSYLLRFDFSIPEYFYLQFATCVAWLIALKLLVFFAMGQFRDSLSYFSMPDLRRIVYACTIAMAIAWSAAQIVALPNVPPRSVVIFDAVLSCAFLCGGRLLIKYVREISITPRQRHPRRMRRIGIVGAGDTGTALAMELRSKSWLGMTPVAFFDDFRRPKSRVHGIAVWGRPECLLDRSRHLKLDEVIIALPSAPGERLRGIVNILQEACVQFRTVPSLAQLATGAMAVTNLRPVQIEDLLGRDSIQIDPEKVGTMIRDRTVLVTGAGGSIGSEICRQISRLKPAALLLVERSEAALFPIEQELVELGHGSILTPLVADIMDRARMQSIFESFQPDLVFHAAAHKHVPMMESQPGEAIRNNVLGTAQLAELAHAANVSRFVMISTDKAINPTNVMGATKRLAENLVQSIQGRSGSSTIFAVVRFGNVLGSSGSVIPTFARQIGAGGPVKVTHPDVTRYFMTIPEAVSLVLQSAVRACGGEIYLLDMGKPVRIAELARQMIELSGLRAGTDIDIVFTGLRPGEKLYEELSYGAEQIMPTDHPKILRLLCQAPSYEAVRERIASLSQALHSKSPDEIKHLLKESIPEYRPQFSQNAAARNPRATLEAR